MLFLMGLFLGTSVYFVSVAFTIIWEEITQKNIFEYVSVVTKTFTQQDPNCKCYLLSLTYLSMPRTYKIKRNKCYWYAKSKKTFKKCLYENWVCR